MNWSAIFTIIKKDLKVAVQNKGVMIPIAVLCLVFFVIAPGGVTALVPTLFTGGGTGDSEVVKMITSWTAGSQQGYSGLNMSQKTTLYFLLFTLAPMFLMVPLMVASTIAADSFAGEKERKTLEALLYSPTTDRELFVAKLLSAWLAAIGVALGGFVLYSVTANVAAWPQFGYLIFPNAMWLVLILWVVPALAGLGLSVMVLASSRAQGFQDASQIGGIVVLPMVALFYGQVAGVIVFNVSVVLVMGLVIWLLDGLLIYLGSRSFHRNRMLAG